jgi:NADPH:quinone reductase-like Zn-dependent oxidoreductase
VPFGAGTVTRSEETNEAIELTGLEGFKSLGVVEADKPTPDPNQVLIKIKAAAIMD